MRREYNAILTITFRDLTKFVRDRARIFASFIFPVIFIAVLGGSMQANLSDKLGFSLLVFTFTGVLAQTLFQSTAAGIISLIEDRENDFSQEIFVSPISRYSIIVGKILGESLVALSQALGILILGLILQVPLSLEIIIRILPAMLVACLLGGAFGIVVLSNLQNQRAANQIFPFLIFPQFFLAGVFAPISNLPLPLYILSRLSPMTYAVDFLRASYYAFDPAYPLVVLHSLSTNLLVIFSMILVFVVMGTFMFVRNERNR